MSIEKMFPICMIVLSSLSSIVYIAHGDIRRAIYWAAGAVLTASVTF